MESAIELIRAAHEEIDHLERAACNQLLKKTKLHKEQLLQEHRAKRFISKISEKATFVLELYSDVS
jgi:splicing factor 3A subunit 3